MSRINPEARAALHALSATRYAELVDLWRVWEQARNVRMDAEIDAGFAAGGVALPDRKAALVAYKAACARATAADLALYAFEQAHMGGHEYDPDAS